jgi:DNA-directed RNA polymerase subunit RPC12/RpoP
MSYNTGHCPQCGVKFNARDSSIDTVRQCQACGFKFVLRRPPSIFAAAFSAIGCVGSLITFLLLIGIAFAVCGGIAYMLGNFDESPPDKPASTAKTESPETPVAAEAAPPVADTDAPAAFSTPPMADEPKRPPAVAEAQTADGMRHWADKSGKFSTEAKFGGLSGATVTLHKSDGTTIKVQFDQLSDADQKWIEGRRKAHSP